MVSFSSSLNLLWIGSGRGSVKDLYFGWNQSNSGDMFIIVPINQLYQWLKLSMQKCYTYQVRRAK